VGAVLSLLLLIVVVVVVLAVALHQGSSSVVQYKQVVAHGWRDAVSQVQGIISKYTR
jgi:hypothetical protein